MKGRLPLIPLIVALLAISIALLHRPISYNGFTIPPRSITENPSVVRVISSIKALVPLRGATQTNGNGCQCGAVVDPAEEGAACQLEGVVPDCCCSYTSVERVNRDAVKPILEELVTSPFFRYFKVDLYCDCPLWPDDAMCSLRDCSVCECEADEVPEPWRLEEEADFIQSCDSAQRESNVDRTIQPSMKAKLLNIKNWKGYHNPWMPEADEGVDYVYVNLLTNPERFTGYKGEHANRVWGAIYEQECFKDINESTCPEKRVFYKLISGMHSSITAHIVGDYLLDEASGTWGPNLEMFKWRLGNPDVRDRVENLYFTYLFVLRAVLKAGPVLEQADYHTGTPEEDARTKELVQKLVNNESLKKSCPIPFDEGRLWTGEDGEELKQQLQRHFQNITTIMDCVGCEKCKMWGKLQLLGIATSLKILFSAEDCQGSPHNGGLVLERNEVIALINLLERLSFSVEVVRDLSLQLSGVTHPSGLGAIQDLAQEGLAPSLKP